MKKQASPVSFDSSIQDKESQKYQRTNWYLPVIYLGKIQIGKVLGYWVYGESNQSRWSKQSTISVSIWSLRVVTQRQSSLFYKTTRLSGSFWLSSNKFVIVRCNNIFQVHSKYHPDSKIWYGGIETSSHATASQFFFQSRTIVFFKVALLLDFSIQKATL